MCLLASFNRRSHPLLPRSGRRGGSARERADGEVSRDFVFSELATRRVL